MEELCPQFVNDLKGFDNVDVNKTLMTTKKGSRMDLDEGDLTNLLGKGNKL